GEVCGRQLSLSKGEKPFGHSRRGSCKCSVGAGLRPAPTIPRLYSRPALAGWLTSAILCATPGCPALFSMTLATVNQGGKYARRYARTRSAPTEPGCTGDPAPGARR